MSFQLQEGYSENTTLSILYSFSPHDSSNMGHVFSSQKDGRDW